MQVPYYSCKMEAVLITPKKAKNTKVRFQIKKNKWS